jgi:hypothetical protein
VEVVKSNLEDNEMMGMKDKKECFKEFEGIEWIEFVEDIRN